MAISFTYDDIDFSGLLTVNKIDGRGFAPTSAVLSPKVPKMPGRHFIRKERDARDLVVEVSVKGNNLADLRDQIDSVAGKLDTDQEVDIVFSDEPDRTYRGIMLADGGLEQVRSFGKGTIHFHCSDPYKYAPETSKAVQGSSTTVMVEGTAETLPRFEIDVLEDTTHIDIISGTGDYMRIGEPAPADAPKYERMTQILHDTCSTTTGWTTADDVEGGYIRGSITSNGERFEVASVGTTVEPNGFQGPSIKKGLGQSLTDFRMDCMFELQNVGNGTGIIEVYLKDANNKTVAKVGFEDVFSSGDEPRGKLHLGDRGDGNQYQWYTYADYPHGWQNFKGVMRIHSHNHTEGGERRIRPYWALVYADGTHDWRRSNYVYIDKNNDYGQPITQIQVAMRSWGGDNTPTPPMYISDLKVWKYNAPTGSAVETLFHSGDTVVIDHETEDILLNGESIKERKEYGATFFGLNPGIQTLYHNPQTALDVTAYYKPAYK